MRTARPISRLFERGFSTLAAFLLTATFLRADQAAIPPSNDAELRRKVVGVWEDDYQGRRTMTVRADGTAVMLVKLAGWKAALYASQLEFQMIWSIEGGRMKKQTTGGKPPGKVKAILKMMGDRVDEQILELTPERLVLLDQNGKRRYEWRRVRPARPSNAADGKVPG